MPRITARTLKEARPGESAYFIRDTELKGFGVRVFPSGTIKFIAEVWVHGSSHRKTLGSHPVLKLKDARSSALAFLSETLRSPRILKTNRSSKTLSEVFQDYLERKDLKESTVKSHKEVIRCYLKDWLDKPIKSIGKVEKRKTSREHGRRIIKA
jgi:hypothetical protein